MLGRQSAYIESNKRHKIPHIYIRIALYILITAVFLYSPFIFGGKILVYGDIGYDTFHQYLPARQFFVNLLNDGCSKGYSFAYGLGESIFTPWPWISDPFSMLSVLYGLLFGAEKVGESIVYVQILKIMTAGILCTYFLKHHHFSDKASMLSSYIYAFSGYMITSGEHYAFSLIPVYLMLILIMADCALCGRHFFALIFATALVGLQSPYTTYMVLLTAAAYVILCAVRKNKKNLKKAFKEVFIIGMMMVIGLFLSAFSFLPISEIILECPRVINGVSFFDKIKQSLQLASPEVIQTCILRLFSSNAEGWANSWHGASFHWDIFTCFYSALLVPFLGQFIRKTLFGNFDKSEKIIRMIPIAVLLFSIFDVFIASLFNAFSCPYYRFGFIFLPFFAYVTAESFDDIRRGICFSRIWNWAFLGISLALFVLGTYKLLKIDEHVIFPFIETISVLVIGTILMDLLFLASQQEKVLENYHGKLSNALSACLIGVIVFNLFIENAMTLYSGRSIVTKEAAESPPNICEVAQIVNTKEQDNFCRMETTVHEQNMPDAMYSLLMPFRSASYYNTAISGNMQDFVSEMASNWNYTTRIYAKPYYAYGSTGDPLIADILGIKYILSQDDFESAGWQRERTLHGMSLYRNTDLSSSGLLFHQYISQEAMEQQNSDQKQMGMAQRILLEDVPDDIENYAAENNQLDIKAQAALIPSEQFIWNSGIQYETVELLNDGSLHLKGTSESAESNFAIPLNTECLNNDEYYTRITIHSKGEFPFRECCTTAHHGNVVNIFLREYALEKNELGDVSYSFSIPQNAESIVFAFVKKGTFDFTISSKTVQKQYKNEGISFENPKMGGVVTGTVQADDNCLLYMPIPYSRDWSACLDGEEVEILKANYAFCAIEMPGGTHHVEFTYKNHAFEVGCVVSAVTLVVLCGAFVYKKKGRKKDDQL